MSECGVGVVERELLDRARDAEIARRRDYYARLELVAELDRCGVAAVTGDRGTVRLLEALWNVDHGEAKRWLDEAAELVVARSLSGEVLPPRLPCTAVAGGGIGAGHVAVIRRTMQRLERVDTLAVEDWVEADRFLAEKAAGMSPAGLAQLARALIATLAPDGEGSTTRQGRRARLPQRGPPPRAPGQVAAESVRAGTGSIVSVMTDPSPRTRPEREGQLHRQSDTSRGDDQCGPSAACIGAGHPRVAWRARSVSSHLAESQADSVESSAVEAAGHSGVGRSREHSR